MKKASKRRPSWNEDIVWIYRSIQILECCRPIFDAAKKFSEIATSPMPPALLADLYEFQDHCDEFVIIGERAISRAAENDFDEEDTMFLQSMVDDVRGWSRD